MAIISNPKLFFVNTAIAVGVVLFILLLRFAANYLIENEVFSGNEKDNNPFIKQEKPQDDEERNYE